MIIGAYSTKNRNRDLDNACVLHNVQMCYDKI